MSHVHWDHIMGFPFFGPAYVPGTHIRIHGCHEVMEQAFRLQHAGYASAVALVLLVITLAFSIVNIRLLERGAEAGT